MTIFNQELKQNGYLLLKDVISKNECIKFVKLLNKHYDNFHKLYSNNETNSGLSDKSQEKVVYNLHNKDKSWMKLFENRIILDVISPFLKEGSFESDEPFYLNNISARTPLLGNKGQQIHIDSNLPGVNYMLSVNVMWYFENSTKKNGATIIVPDTQTIKKYCPNGYMPKEAIQIEAEPGDVLIFNPNLWHGGGGNFDGSSRWALVLSYARWFVKPSFDFFYNTPREIYETWTEAQRQLLGFNLSPPKSEFVRLRRRTDISEPPLN